MNQRLNELMEHFLQVYPDAQGALFHSMELPVELYVGAAEETLDRYKDIPMMSVDESFNTIFNFIITEHGTIVIFFFQKMHFVSVFVARDTPDRELAKRMYDSFKVDFEKVISELYEAESVY